VADVVTLFVFQNTSNTQIRVALSSATVVPLSAMVVLGRVPVAGMNEDALTLGFLNSSSLSAEQAAALVYEKARLGGVSGTYGAAPGYFNNPTTTPTAAPKSKPSTAVIIGAAVGGVVVLVIVAVVVKKVLAARSAAFDQDYIAMNSVSVNNYEHV
jgi:hypothetical protein